MAAIINLFGGDRNDDPSETLGRLCSHPGSANSFQRLPDSRFDEIARALAAVGMATSWVQRPRIYFLLHNVGKRESMPMFIAQGHDDSFIPYPDRQALPHAERSFFDHDQAAEFLKLQTVCESDVLEVEKGNGKRCSFDNGDDLFESLKKRLGTGSQEYVEIPCVCFIAICKLIARSGLRRLIG